MVVSLGFVVGAVGPVGVVLVGAELCRDGVEEQHVSKASTAMAAVSPLPDGKDLWLVSIEVGLCDTGSPECRMVCHQSGGYQDRRFKKGGSLRDSYGR